MELFYASSEANNLEMPNNICITPLGDLWISEDGGGVDRIIGVTPEGEVYVFAENRVNNSEFAQAQGISPLEAAVFQRHGMRI